MSTAVETRHQWNSDLEKILLFSENLTGKKTIFIS